MIFVDVKSGLSGGQVSGSHSSQVWSTVESGVWSGVTAVWSLESQQCGVTAVWSHSHKECGVTGSHRLRKHWCSSGYLEMAHVALANMSRVYSKDIISV